MLVQAPETTPVFDRIVCGVDSSPESSSRRLVRPIDCARPSLLSGHRRGRQRGRARRLFGDPRAGRVGRGGTGRASRGRRRRPPSSTHLLAGDPVPSLLDELRRSDATLVSVGPRT